jgi:hypothetical protein
MARHVAILLMCAVAVGACADSEPVFETSPGTVGGPPATVAIDSDLLIDLVLALPEDDVFALLDSLSDDDYEALLSEVGAAGDAEFVAGLSFESAALLVDSLDEATRHELRVAAETGVDPNAESPIGPAAAGTVTAVAPDLRRVDTGALGLRGRVMVEIGTDDMSFLAFARSADPDAQVFVISVVSPSGVDVVDEVGIEYGEFTNTGEAAFYAPLTDTFSLEPGTYEVAFESTAEITESGALVRSGSTEGPMAIDVIFWMATTEVYDRDALEARFREIGDEVFGPHDVTVGTMSFIDPPQEIIEQYSSLSFKAVSEADLLGLCRAMSSSVGPVRALNFAIVDELLGGGADSIIEGSSSGLPGTVLLADSGLSCVAAMAAPDPDFPARDLFERAIVVWHEAGHHLGLYHPTEEDGLFFDVISDTAECPAVEYDTDDDGYIDVFECAAAGGDNFLFYDGDGTVMTSGQAFVLRRHPLLYPVG